MKTLVQQAPNYGQMASESEDAKQFCDTELKGDEEVDERVARNLAVLWKDPGIQAAWQNRSKFQLMDSAAYFFEKIMDVRDSRADPRSHTLCLCLSADCTEELRA